MEYMYKVLNDQDIPSDVGIAIEYNIPQISKRVDFLISGYGKKEDANVVLIELKQWDELKAIRGRDGLVETYTGNAVRQVVYRLGEISNMKSCEKKDIVIIDPNERGCYSRGAVYYCKSFANPARVS